MSFLLFVFREAGMIPVFYFPPQLGELVDFDFLDGLFVVLAALPPAPMIRTKRAPTREPETDVNGIFFFFFFNTFVKAF